MKHPQITPDAIDIRAELIATTSIPLDGEDMRALIRAVKHCDCPAKRRSEIVSFLRPLLLNK